jgi:hypothetical protein
VTDVANSPRPAKDRILRIIGAATLVDDRRVINCWEVWLGGFDIVARYDITDKKINGIRSLHS